MILLIIIDQEWIVLLMNFYERKLAFTLAEVLITLVIIGVIAALTVPALIKNNKKQETIAQLKKVYSGVNQAIKLAEIDNGPCKTWDWPQGPEGIDERAQKLDGIMKNILLPQMKVGKYCGLNTNQGCFFGGLYKDIDGLNMTTTPASVYYFSPEGANTISKVLLADGAALAIYYGNDYFYVDLNGPGKPNRLGYDLYLFGIDVDKARLVGVGDPYAFCSLGSTNMGWIHGFGCAGRIIITDNWDITYW